MPIKVLLFANTEWYLFNFRLPLAKALRDLGAEVVLVSPAGPYGSQLERQGFRWIALPMTRRSLNPLREFTLLLRIARVYRAEAPTVAHHFTLKCVIYGSLVARLTNVGRRINAVAGMGYIFMNTALYARLLRPLVRLFLRLSLGGKNARLIVQNSDDLAIFSRAGALNAHEIRLIRGSGVDTTRFQPSLAARSAGEPVRLLFAARILWDKGIGEFLAAAQLLQEKGLHAEFIVAGEPDPGNPATVPPDVLDEWKRSQVAKFVGHVQDMERLLAEVDIAVLPSYREGAPRSLIEAAACGLPIITTDVPGCREVVEHEVTGLLVPAREVAPLASAIQYLVENPEMRQRMGSAGRQKVMREYDERIVLEKTIDVYRELLQGQAFA